MADFDDEKEDIQRDIQIAIKRLEDAISKVEEFNGTESNISALRSAISNLEEESSMLEGYSKKDSDSASGSDDFASDMYPL